jgi:hypothetical protein
MMQAGKDYIAKDEPEHENARFDHLRELIRVINAQSAPAEVEASEPVEKEELPAPKLTNQSKPTLKLTK